MNFRNRYLVIAIRTLLGFMMLASGISGLLMGNSTKGVPPQMVNFTQVFWASGIFQMVKVTEIVAGFMLLVGILPALATLFLAPDVVGIVIVNARLMPSFLWIGGIAFVLTAYLGYAYWDKYKPIFSRN
jgi:putative oxidoreductase